MASITTTRSLKAFNLTPAPNIQWFTQREYQMCSLVAFKEHFIHGKTWSHLQEVWQGVQERRHVAVTLPVCHEARHLWNSSFISCWQIFHVQASLRMPGISYTKHIIMSRMILNRLNIFTDFHRFDFTGWLVCWRALGCSWSASPNCSCQKWSWLGSPGMRQQPPLLLALRPTQSKEYTIDHG